MITAAALAITLRPTIEDLTATFRSYRTFAEGVKLAAHRVAARGAGQLPLQHSALVCLIQRASWQNPSSGNT